MPAETPPGRVRTWLQLLRAPNLFTVPGDPLAGALVASAGFVEGGVWLALWCSFCMYAGGLLDNDLADLEEDRQERPGRPLPSGAAHPRTVRVVSILLALAGVLPLLFTPRPWPAFGCSLGLGLAIVVYNHVTKRWSVLGALNMGLCRALSVMLGAFVMPDSGGRQLAVPVAVIFGLYIAAVTNLARHETRARIPRLARALPAVVLVLASLIGLQQASLAPEKAGAGVIFAVLAGAVLWLAWRMYRRLGPLPPLIGAHIRLLLPLQAALCWFADPYEIGRTAALALLALWPVSKAFSRRFYAS